MADIELTISKMTKSKLGIVDESPKPAQPDPTLTIAKIEAVVADIRRIEQCNGYHGIAEIHGIPVGLVERMHRAVKARIAELTTTAVEPEERG